jgi:uncharacterized membrane protein YedE/YeeE
MNEWLQEHLWNTLPEHIIWLTFGAIILVLSGAAPEEWLKSFIEKLIPSITHTMSVGTLALITRVVFGLIGILVIVVVLASQAVNLALTGMIVFGCGFFICAAWYFWPAGDQHSSTAGAPSALTSHPAATPAAPPAQQPSRPPESQVRRRLTASR